MTVGIDVLEIERAAQIEQIKHKIFTETELEYINQFTDKKERLAGFFTAKEAVFKCLNFNVLHHLEIEILHQSSGKPYIKFYGKTLEHFNNNFTHIDVSISHSKTIATSIAVAKRKNKVSLL